MFTLKARAPIGDSEVREYSGSDGVYVMKPASEVAMSVLNASTVVFFALVAIATAASAAQTRDSPESRVQVVFVQPEKFRDVGDRYAGGGSARDFYLKDLDRYIQARGTRLLSEGERLVVSITDIDMAGAFEPWRGRLGDVRIVRDVYSPRIDLAFTLTGADGAVMKRGERKLRDLALVGSPTASGSDPLRYEKALLDDWLERELKADAAGRASVSR
jgi:hypothetical protein